MPDRDGLLSEEERKAAIEWMTTNKAIKPCPACDFQQWNIGDRVGLISISASMFAVGAGYPAILVFCARCGYMRIHSAIMMGILRSGDTNTKPEAANG